MDAGCGGAPAEGAGPGWRPETLQRLAYTYIGPGVVFPNFPNPPGGWTIRIAVDRISGSDEALAPA